MIKSPIEISQVQNWPTDDPRAKIKRAKSGQDYVIIRATRKEQIPGKSRYEDRNLGRVMEIGGLYYFLSPETFKCVFMRNGEPRAGVDAVTIIKKQKPIKLDMDHLKPMVRGTKGKSKKVKATVTIQDTACEPALLENGQEKEIGMLPIFWEIASQTGVIQHLIACYGARAAMALLSMAFCSMIRNESVAKRTEIWMERFCHPFGHVMSDTAIGDFYDEVGARSDCLNKFFALRMQRCSDSYFAFDSTSVLTSAGKIVEAKLGLSKNKTVERMVGLSLLYATNSKMPVMFRIQDGNIPDVVTLEQLELHLSAMLGEGRTKICKTIADRGYFSMENIRTGSRSKHEYLIAAKTDSKWVAEKINDSLPELEDFLSSLPYDRGVRGVTHQIVENGHDGEEPVTYWLHIYRDTVRAEKAATEFLKGLDKFEYRLKERISTAEERKRYGMFYEPRTSSNQINWIKNPKAIREHLRRLTIFASVTTWECTASDAFKVYDGRDCIEKSFRDGKSDLGMDSLRVHTSSRMHARCLVGMIAMTIWSQIKVRSGMNYTVSIPNRKKIDERSLKQDGISPKDLVQIFEGVRVFVDQNGISHYSEITAMRHEFAARLGCPDVYKNVPEFAQRDYVKSLMAKELEEAV